jgi:glyoxalase-like protein
MLTAIDHVLIACVDPDAAAMDLEAAVGLRASAGGRHLAHGTFNRLVWLGDSYIELMGVFDPALAASSWWGQHALQVLAAGGGFMGVVIASDDLSSDVARLRVAGSVLGEPEAGSRTRPDGQVVRWQIAHEPAPDPDLGLLFLIEHDTSGAEWTPEERAARSATAHPVGGPVRLERVEVPVSSTHRATMRVHRDVGVAFRPSLAGAGARDGAVGRQTLRLFPAAQKDPPRVVVRGGPLGREVVLLGCQWLVEPAG